MLSEEQGLAIVAAISNFRRVNALAAHRPRPNFVPQVGLKNLLSEPPHKRSSFDGKNHFHPATQVSGHQVGAAEITFAQAIIVKVVNAAMFKEAAQNAYYADILADPGNFRAQTARAPHNQIDRHTRLGGPVQQLNDRTIFESIHFENQMPFAAAM